jgi:hypothetical protein
MTPVGYEFLRQTLQLTAFAPRCPALLKPVTRVEPTDGFLAIPFILRHRAAHGVPSTGNPV